MTERRKHPRWTQAERYLPPVRRSPWLALVAAGMMVIVLNAAPQESSDVRASVKTSKATDGRPSSISASAVAAPICASYTGLIPADASVTEWCIKTVSKL